MTRRTHLPAYAATQSAQKIAALIAMGRAYQKSGQLKLAEQCCREVLALDSNNPDGLHLLGVVAFQSGAVKEAILFMKRAARKKPRDPEILVNLGAAYRKGKQQIEAREAYKAALRLKPDSADAHFNLGNLLMDSQEFELAVESHQRSLAIDPMNSDAYLNLGNAYKLMGQGDNAIAAYKEALRVSPTLAKAYGNIAAVFVDRGRHAEALAFMDAAIAIDPSPGELRFKRSLIALRLGKFSPGWEDYESRFYAETERIWRFTTPPAYWAGEDLTDKTLLLWTEQGLGDEILYAGMINEIASRARQCVIECSPRMVPVFARSFPQASVLRYQGQGFRSTPPGDIDTQISITSLGAYLRPTLDSFPRHKGYLKADPARTAALRSRYQALSPGNLVVGLSWRSKNDRIGEQKSADLTTWREILNVPGVTFINLQYGDCAVELAATKQTLDIDVFQDPEVNPIKSMDDFFAQVAAMDLVITTSNTTVHVAGSLDVDTWLLLPGGLASIWYWLLDRSDSPWYPSVRIFRRAEEADGGQKADYWWRDGVIRAGHALMLRTKELATDSIRQLPEAQELP